MCRGHIGVCSVYLNGTKYGSSFSRNHKTKQTNAREERKNMQNGALRPGHGEQVSRNVFFVFGYLFAYVLFFGLGDNVTWIRNPKQIQHKKMETV